jgi:hypothetical protein
MSNQPVKLAHAEMLAMMVAFARDWPRCTLEIDTSELVILLDTIREQVNDPDYPEYSKRVMLGLVSKLIRHFEPNPALASLIRTEWASAARVTNTQSLVPKGG